MTVALITFAATLTMVLGSYWALIVRPEAQLSGRLRRRLQVKIDRPVGASIVKGGGAGRESSGGGRRPAISA